MLQAKQCLITTSSIATPISLINVLQKKVVEDVEDSMHMSTSYAETVSALLNSPQSNLLSINKENSTAICKDIDSAGSENGCKTTRKRSLTEMIGQKLFHKRIIIRIQIQDRFEFARFFCSHYFFV